jgi:hypothetical protein
MEIEPMRRFEMSRIATIIFSILTICVIHSEGQAMDKEWFQTWDRPEYLEWATEIPEGYLLHIIRKEQGNYLVVQAKLIMGEKGLPGFEVIQQCRMPSKEEAKSQLQSWVDAALSLQT